MGKVVFDISMSLDGFMTAAGQRPDEPMGEGGQRLVEWAFGADERDRAVLTDGIAGVGAVIAGNRTYATSLPWWGADGPTGSGQQHLRAGLVDELSIHLVPVLLGAGTRMFENLGEQHIQLENGGSVQTSSATHLRFPVAR
jgi:hypothetical protein